MSQIGRAVCRGGPAQYDGRTRPIAPADQQLWFQNGDYGGPGGVYARTDVVEQLPDGPAVIFVSLGLDVEG